VLIEVRDATYSYPEGVTALKGISLCIDAGEQVALVGHNGSGKSTLARLFNGLLLPSSGEVLVDGVKTNSCTVAGLARKIALLFQNPDDQICKRKVWDEVAFGPKNLGYPAERIGGLVEESLSLFGLSSHEGRNPYDLGYSERKRLALASVVAMDTDLLMLDEPTAGLDSREVAMLTATLQDLKRRGKAVVVISHDMDFVAENCSRAVCLETGKMRFDGEVSKLFEEHALLEKCGLRPCQSAQLGAHYGVKPATLTPQGFVVSLAFGESAERLSEKS
jgi:energy-coupling factor transport system ATP-binding protein